MAAEVFGKRKRRLRWRRRTLPDALAGGARRQPRRRHSQAGAPAAPSR
jgi:hypothetical protein